MEITFQNRMTGKDSIIHRYSLLYDNPVQNLSLYYESFPGEHVTSWKIVKQMKQDTSAPLDSESGKGPLAFQLPELV